MKLLCCDVDSGTVCVTDREGPSSNLWQDTLTEHIRWHRAVWHVALVQRDILPVFLSPLRNPTHTCLRLQTLRSGLARRVLGYTE